MYQHKTAMFILIFVFCFVFVLPARIHYNHKHKLQLHFFLDKAVKDIYCVQAFFNSWWEMLRIFLLYTKAVFKEKKYLCDCLSLTGSDEICGDINKSELLIFGHEIWAF